MNKLLIACMSAAFVLSVNAADWFNGFPPSGGTWSNKKSDAEPITLESGSEEVVFTATDKTKSLDNDVVTITSTVALTAYDELPKVAAGTKAALASVDDGETVAYYGLVSGKFVKLTGATPTDEEVTVKIEMRKVLNVTQVRYSIGTTVLADANENTWMTTEVDSAPTEVAYSGTGTVKTLVGTTEAMAATVGFQVIIAEGANVKATVKIDGETVETVPSTLTEGQTYAVTFAPVEGYMFESAPEPVSGKVGKDNITVNAPSAVKIVATAKNAEGTVVPCASLQAALTLGGTVTLAADTTVTDWQIVNTAVTLDLGGKKLTGTGFPSDHDAVIAVSRGGTLTVKNGTVDGSALLAGIKLTANNALDRIDPATYSDDNKATLIVDGATVIGNQYGICGNGNIGRGNTAVTIKGGLVKAVNTGAEESVGIYNPQAGTVVVDGGTVEGVYYGIYAKSGTVTINGGTVKATAAEAVEPTAYNNGTNGKGYAVVLEKGTASGGYANGLEATITGGTFESVGAPVLSWTRDTATAPALAGLITDGKFKGGAMDAALIASQDDMIASWTTDGDGYQTPTWTEDTAPRTLVVGAGETGEFHLKSDTTGTKEGSTKSYTVRAEDTVVFDETFTGALYIDNDAAYAKLVVKSGATVTVGHNGTAYANGNFPSGSTVEVEENATVLLTRWGGTAHSESIGGGGDYTINLDGVTFTGEGLVKVVKPNDTVAPIVSGTIHGDATIELETMATVVDKADHALAFGEDWTGTIVLPAMTQAQGLNFNKYGRTGSTVRLTGIDSGWMVVANITFNPTIDLAGDVTFDEYSQRSYVYTEITGSGNLTFGNKNGTANTPSALTVSKVDLSKYTGAIANISKRTVTIAELVTTLKEVPAEKTKVLAATDTTVTAVKFANGDAVDAKNVFVEADGIYVGPDSSVDPVDPETPKTYDDKESADEAAAAINDDKVNLINAPADVPAGFDKAKYVANFEAVVTDDNKVVVQLTAAAEEAVQQAVDDAQETVLNPDEEGKATIVTKPGFYYGIAAVEELEAMEDAQPASWTMAESTELKLEVTKPSPTKGFYRVMSTVKPPVGE